MQLHVLRAYPILFLSEWFVFSFLDSAVEMDEAIQLVSMHARYCVCAMIIL